MFHTASDGGLCLANQIWNGCHNSAHAVRTCAGCWLDVAVQGGEGVHAAQMFHCGIILCV